MKINFKIISSILIIGLSILLISILVNYFNTPIKVNNTNPIIIESIANNQNTPKHLINDEISGDGDLNLKEENVKQDESGEISIKSTDEEKGVPSKNIPEDNSKTPVNNTVNNNSVPKDTKNNQVIMSSEDTMTNKEKREILTELDNTLMELLDVVDKVQTVDETRLNGNESEVQ